MMSRGRLSLAAVFLLPGVLLAQQLPEHVSATAFREAERYAHCWTSNDAPCIAEMTAQEQLAAAGLMPDELDRVLTRAARRAGMVSDGGFHLLEVAQPWPPFMAGDEIFAFVPYYELAGYEPVGTQSEVTSYLIGVSDGDGRIWRFIMMSNYSVLRPDEIDRVIPGYDDRPRPAIHERSASRLARTRWVRTTDRRFAFVDGAFAYALKFDIRTAHEGPIDIAVQVDDPADPDRPLQFHESLGPGQRILDWQSPVLHGFEDGNTYEVAIEGRRADTGARLFRHRDQLVFEPTSHEYWLAVISKPPQSYAEPAPGP